MTLDPPARRGRGSNGEWDEPRDFRAADFVTDEEGTGFVHCAPSPRDGGIRALPRSRHARAGHHLQRDGRRHLPRGPALLRRQARSSSRTARRATPTRRSSTSWSRSAACWRAARSSTPTRIRWRSKAPVIYRNTPQWFAAIDRPVGDGQDTYGKTIRERALTSIDKLVTWTPQIGPQPPLFDDRGAPRLGAVAPARLGRAADLLHEEGRASRPMPISCCAIRRSTPASSRPSRPKARMPGTRTAPRSGSSGNDYDPSDWDQVFDILDVWFD